MIRGTAKPLRELLHVDNCADALVHLMRVYSGYEHVNVGSCSDMTILELVKLVVKVVGFKGAIVLDPAKPDGTPRNFRSKVINTRMAVF